MEYQIRLAKEADAKAVHDIYGAYVPLDYVTFTVGNPDIESYRRKIITTLEKYSFLIAEDSTGKVLGYVYGSALRPHDVYQWNVEWTIVLAPDAPKRRGIAAALYREFAGRYGWKGCLYRYFRLITVRRHSFFPAVSFLKLIQSK